MKRGCIVACGCSGGHLKVVKSSLTETKLYALQAHGFRFKERLFAILLRILFKIETRYY